MRRFTLHCVLILVVGFGAWSGFAVPAARSEERREVSLSQERSVHHQILYSLLVVELASESAERLVVEDLPLQPAEDGALHVWSGSELLGWHDPRVELVLSAHGETDRRHMLAGPQLVVAPGRTGRLYAAQEDLLLDPGESDVVRYTTALELSITPHSGFDWEKNGVLTALDMPSGRGRSGLTTEVWVGAEEPLLVGMVQRSQSAAGRSLPGRTAAERSQYFALYLTAQPSAILTLRSPEAGGLAGLESFFEEVPVGKEGGRGYMQVAVPLAGETQVALSGSIQNAFKTTLRYRLHDLPTGSYRTALTGQVYGYLQLGGEVILCPDTGLNVGVVLHDTVDLASLVLSAGATPLLYSLQAGREDSRWFLRAESAWEEPLQLALEYRSEGKREFLEASLGYQLDASRRLWLGYTRPLHGSAGSKEESIFSVSFSQSFDLPQTGSGAEGAR